MIIDRCCAATKSIVPTTKDNFREAEIVAFEDEEGFFGKAKLKHRGIQFTFDKGAQFTLELGGHLGIMLSNVKMNCARCRDRSKLVFLKPYKAMVDTTFLLDVVEQYKVKFKYRFSKRNCQTFTWFCLYIHGFDDPTLVSTNQGKICPRVREFANLVRMKYIAKENGRGPTIGSSDNDIQNFPEADPTELDEFFSDDVPDGEVKHGASSTVSPSSSLSTVLIIGGIAAVGVLLFVLARRRK